VSWLQLELRATPQTLDSAEAVLMACGALSITLVSDANEPVLEPNPGETPLWSSVRVQALMPLDTDMGELRRQLQTLGAGTLDDASVAFINAKQWQDAARTFAVDAVFAGRLRLLPKDIELTEADRASGLVCLRLEPGLAFGSGSHPTTRLCLQWLAQHIQPGMRVLDFGCGSGVLGIAAGLLGASVVAVDHDPQAGMATTENAAYNGLSSANIKVMSLAQWQDYEAIGEFDVIVANILAGPLQELAAAFEAVARPGAHIVLSGVLTEQAEQVMSSYQQTQFVAPVTESGWACLLGTVLQHAD
jgi:ribosomal protein L11 methyltransferase